MTDWPEPRNPTQLLQSLAYRVEKLEQEMTEHPRSPRKSTTWKLNASSLPTRPACPRSA